MTDYLTLNVMLSSRSDFQIILTKLLPQAHFHFEFYSHYIVRYQVVQSCTCMEYEKKYNFWLLSHIKIQPLNPVVDLKEHIILGGIISHNHKEDTYKTHHKSVFG